ncbi:phospho-sugar mutase [Opitutus terrae]|uniref:Phosphoglucomutase/phosphomannomutase alpha/beta/alpha domain I n=1 Tax=Opitutus terrae (strain DSM 11246 / JCM 15787 / PB90-1) TaxID=452637 RepID=B1ZYC3_OPITP|nr:phospho-sugar mutase [Opitutus terrae]ACB77021.1 phosphoglucomutase/phosphomannomutase alpha/beta/alpha domain I [Opitutus terrae PB90-1]
MTTLDRLQNARRDGQLLPAAVDNIASFLAAPLPGWAHASIEELVAQGAWGELNDRFYRFLEFGTGGMRGRTIGVVSTKAELGRTQPGGTGSPEHAAIGTNVLNDFTLIRATIGLFRYTSSYLKSRGVTAKPRLVIAHDVRHFSRHFCELAASTWTRLGGEAFIFDGPRSTPQLSFSVRWLKAHAGVVITASHNPPHDNGFKAYFDDGAQVVPPHDAGIVREVNAVPLKQLADYVDKQLTGVTTLGRDADDRYLAVASTAAVDPGVFRRSRLSIVFTNIHGTGAVQTLPLLLHAGCAVETVPEQLEFDARFPTVKSPNPENPAALAMAMALAEKNGADVVLATDPDADRMGCAVRNREGKLELLTGNQIGALLTAYRLEKFKQIGWVPPAGSKNVCIVNTFVTSQLQDAIGHSHGVKVIKTLTGFKWIAAKMRRYEEQLTQAMGANFDYDETPFEKRVKLLQQHSTFYAFGCEESYGYLPNDYVRDKDGNAACLMFAEVCAAAKGRGITVPEYLDELYLKHGFYLEGTINLYYEGASGNAKIRRILETYRSNPPTKFGDVTVTKFEDFGRQEIRDADGEVIPKQDLYFVTLSNGCSFAARGSGTEPKMKFYLFAREQVANAGELAAVKARVKATLATLSQVIEADAKARAES